MIVSTTINGVARELSCASSETLLDALRAAGFVGVKEGCREGTCGACVVLVDGQARNACLMLAGQVEGRDVTTIEGLGSVGEPHPLQQAFVDASAVQCGFCTPGAILSAKALLDEEPNPSAERIKQALDGNLCRCTGYVKMVDAVQIAAERMRAGRDE